MEANIESHLKETRVFKPARDFAKKARIGSFEQYRRMHRESIRQPEKFWAREARELHWQQPWKRVLEWKVPFAKWFVGGKLNLSENCLDRHLQGPRRNKAAILWEGEPGDKRVLTYQQLHREVCRFANVLKRNKIRKGDRVIIYLPTIPEAAIAMLACARIGAIHSVVFGGFSADSIRDRIADCGAIAVITADGAYRRGGIVPLKHNVDAALKNGTTVKRVIVFRRAGKPNSYQRRARRLVASGVGICRRALPAGRARQRASALHSLHQRLDRKTERHSPHHRRLSGRHSRHREVRLRPAGGRYLLVHG
jgi:acetyl-CoA synthetase